MISDFWLVLGYDCNNRCRHCYASPSGFLSEWMPLSFGKGVMKTLKNEGAKTCLLLGGEPTLYPNLIDLVSFGAKVGLEMVVISNGRFFKDEVFTRRLFSVGLNRVIVSLVGADEKTHNRITRSNGFVEMATGISSCADNGRVNALITISKENSYQVVDTIKLAYSLGAGQVVLNCAIPIAGRDIIVAGQSLNPAEVASVIDRVFTVAKRDNFSFRVNATFPLCLLGRETLKEMLSLGWLSVGCHMYRGEGVVFDPTGNVLPCTHFSEFPFITKAKGSSEEFLFQDGFSKVWENPLSEAAIFRSALWKYPARKCAGCEYWGGCVGGCPLFWLFFEPEEYIDREEVSSL
ncbi:MAG: radical SAM protein [Candidatus Falkowbacteria bacterium]